MRIYVGAVVMLGGRQAPRHQCGPHVYFKNHAQLCPHSRLRPEGVGRRRALQAGGHRLHPGGGGVPRGAPPHGGGSAKGSHPRKKAA